MYDVNETDDVISNTVQIVRDIESEVEYRFNISLRGGDVPATEGLSSLSDAGSDFVFMDLVVSFPPNVSRCVTRESVVVSDCLSQCASPGMPPLADSIGNPLTS